MNNAAVTTNNTVRPLRSTDLERVIAIDSAHVGEPRRHFFEKRLAHAKRYVVDEFIRVQIVAGGFIAGAMVVVFIVIGGFGPPVTKRRLEAIAA